jgi:hypothetical protein
MPDLTIRIKRHPDHSASLTCTRRDGSVTWQRQSGQLGQVFPPHDLTHFAVETALGFRRGFYGLVADGWDIADFAAPLPRGPIPEEAREVELLVGFFQADARADTPWTPAEFAAYAESYIASREATRHDSIRRPPALDEPSLQRVRALRDALYTRWFNVGAGEELVLTFGDD